MIRYHITSLATGLLLSSAVPAQTTRPAAITRTIEADWSKPAGPFSRMFEECVGAGRAAEGLRADWQQQLRTVQQEIGFHYIRFHGLLCDEMHVYTEDKEGRPVYNWQYVDKLYDYLLSIHIRPFVELGFMPPDLASGTKTVFWWKGNVTPPKSYEKWSDLIHALTKHFEDRYGRTEVEKWYFEVWNEPDLGGFFAGTQQEYYKLYRTTVAAIKSVSPTYRVGGPATSGSKWIRETLRSMDSARTPLDFISTHSYNTKTVFDEFGLKKRRLLEPTYLSDNVRNTRRIMDSSGHKNLELHYTEFNVSPSSRDPLHDSYQNAAFILQTLKATEHSTNSLSYWTFTDIFEEAGPGPTPFHGGFGLINLQGIRKPTFFAYKFAHEMGATELVTHDTASWVCKNPNGVQVLFWNMQLPFAESDGNFNDSLFRLNPPPKDATPVTLHLHQIPNGKYEVSVYHLGYHHNDPFSAYLEMGAPANLSPAQVATLNQHATGAPDHKTTITITDGNYRSNFPMKQNDIYFIKLVRL